MKRKRLKKASQEDIFFNLFQLLETNDKPLGVIRYHSQDKTTNLLSIIKRIFITIA